MSIPPEGDNEPKYDPRFPEGFGSWREKRYSDEELVVLSEEKKQTEAGQAPTETPEDKSQGKKRLYATGVRVGFSLTDFSRTQKPKKADADQGSEKSTKPLVVGHGEGFHIEASEVKEIYRIGERIPLFRLTPQENNPSGRIRTYSAGFTLAASETPDLAFSITLGSPKGAPISMSMHERNQLTVEADLRKLATEVRDNAACGTFPIEYFYTLDSKMTSVLQRLLLRIYDGENGKIYEALSDQRGLREGGSLTFDDNFHEVKLDGDGKVVPRSPSQHSMAYTLQANTGAENTEAEFLLLSEEERLKVLRRPRLPQFPNALH